MLKRLLRGLAGVLLSFIFCFGVEAEPLRVGNYSFPPYFTPDKPEEGLWAQDLKAIFQAVDRDYEFHHYPPRRLVRYMIEGRADLTVSAKHIAVDQHVHYSKHPLGQIILNVYHKPNRAPVQNMADLKGKTVIVIRGYAYDKRILVLRDPANNVTLIEAQDHEQAVQRLFSGNADYLLDYAQPVTSALRSLRIPEGMFDANTLSAYPVFLLVSKKLPDGEALMSQINAYMSKN